MTTLRIDPSKTFFLLVASALLATGCAAPVQSASEPAADTAEAKEGLALASRVYDAADPAGAYATLTAEERTKLEKAVTPGELLVEETFTNEEQTELRPESVKTPAYSGCYGWHQKYGRKALLGNTLYTYWQSTSVCVTSGRVTSVSVYDFGGETSTPGWRITHSPTTSTKNVSWEGRGKAQYYFVLGAGGWDIQHPSDCIQQRLNGNGKDHASSGSCDLG